MKILYNYSTRSYWYYNNRSVIHFYNNTFFDSNSTNTSLFDINLISNNNDNEYRIIFEENKFINNDITNNNLITFTSNYNNNDTLHNINIFAPKLYLLSNTFLKNKIKSLLFCEIIDINLYLTINYIPFINSKLNLFQNNSIISSIFNINECKLYLSNSNIDNHNLIILSKISIINIFDVMTNNTKLLYLSNIRNNIIDDEIGADINIYSCNFLNDNNLFNIYIKPNDYINVKYSNFTQSSINIFSGDNININNNNNNDNYNNKQLNITNCNFRNYNNQYIYYYDSNFQDWIPNIILSNSLIFNNNGNNISSFQIYNNMK